MKQVVVKSVLSIVVFVSSLGFVLIVFGTIYDAQAKPQIEDVAPYHADIDIDSLNCA